MSHQITFTSAVLGLQGLFNAGVGVSGLLRPASFIQQLSPLGLVPAPAATALSIQLICMGAFAVLISRTPSLHRPALIIRIATHGLAGYLFLQAGETVKPVAMTEFAFAAMNVVALLFSRVEID